MKKLIIWSALLLMLLLPAAVMAEGVAQPVFHVDLTQLVTALLGLLASLVTYRLIPWIKSNTTANQQAMLQSTVRIAVYAAEQLYGSLRGDEKLTYVKSYLSEKGYQVNTNEVRNLIEAYVHELSTQNAKQPARDTKKDAQTSAAE